MVYILGILMGYLMGSFSMAHYLAQRLHVNIRGSGSGNLGGSNVTVLMGWKAGVLTVVCDVGKAMAAVGLTEMLLDAPCIGAAAGMACVLGHIFPFYLGFRGGKGFACYIGTILMLDWKFALAILILVVVATVLTDYIVAGTTLTIVASPIFFALRWGSWLTAAFLCVGTAVMLYKHRDNYVRIFRGEEIGLRSAIRGDNRVKK